ncbi:putative ABC transporter [Aspergillus fischeri NRRL 181]|uniref:ABC transporter, putative n=1 Tax=Neosartorya fischeri (strain ATCC 1020 / DSM 3700 / CBS 544.65 / FGSC A1164 / JCM 1740 / NRRL 181 / WB 181) TaxID=331117 RepID=A1D5S1_NEOFI|nr:ABC transporter, putative [Aspergillus fischeri NRRL 181]EAW21065.1 ABC transporter, putative [Aspergillus fischeri NRRL 181]
MPFINREGNMLHLNQEQFDFNLQFESLFFSIIPSVLFIPSSLWRTLAQIRKPVVVNAPVLQFIKTGVIVLYAGLELALLILAAVGSFHVSRMFITSSILQLISALFMLAVSLVDHSRSPRPSMLLNSYLILTLLLDIARARTLFLSSGPGSEIIYSSIFCASVGLKTAILLLEACQKARWVTWDATKHSPEETSGIFSLGVFFWLNKLFLAGYRHTFTIETLYPLDSSFDAQALHEGFAKKMDYPKLKGDKFALLKVLVRTLWVQLLLPIPPRAALIAFYICQPLFIESLITYLSQSEPAPNVGYGLIGAAILIYSGIGISYALYWYCHHRLRTMVRSILVTETFKAATRIRLGSGDDSAALTLMSTDMERIRMGLRFVHETWASMIQAGLAAWMLYRQLGVVFIAPVGVVVVCFVGLGILINFTGDSQRSWMSGVQKRVGLTATVITSMKSLKISSLAGPVAKYVQQLRVDELAAGARYRRIMIIAAVFAFIPQLISPPLTFAFTQKMLNASTMFTSLSFLTLLTQPLSQLFQSVPELVSGLACLGRIQAFLELEPHQDYRQPLVEAQSCSMEKSSEQFNLKPTDYIIIRDANFGWEADKFVLNTINTQIPASSLTMVIGPIGSGKSTFCKALLGEIPFSQGSVRMSTSPRHVGFCEQTAFLWNGTIRENIIGFTPFNRERYDQVIEATSLRFDLAHLAQGDQTNIGSDGVALSGGQKQRLSLARALYLPSDFLILDDVFSGLDADTEEQVFRQVFGPDGLLRRRGSTVVLCTHSVRHLPTADYIIALENGRLAEQGTFAYLSTHAGYVQRLEVGLKQEGEDTTTNNEPGPRPEHECQTGAGNTKLEPAITVNRTQSSTPIAPAVAAARQVGDATVYKLYVKSMGWFVAACSLFFAALWGLFTNYPTIWLTYWSDATESVHPVHSKSYYTGIYALLQICAIITLLLLGITLFIISVKKAGASLHQQALHTLICAPLSFFTNTDTGVVTNLFSQDLNLIDTELPEATLNTLFCVFQSIGQAAVMLTSSVYLAISYPILGVLLYFVQKYYLRTSRQLRLLDLEAKSPLYTHFLDTLKGIATLRAFGFIPDDIHKNARLVDSSQRAAYLLLMIQEWLNLLLNLVVMVMAAVLTTLAVRLHSNSAFAGASLYSLMTFGESLSGIVIYYTRLETSIGAIARLKTFNETVTPEDRDGPGEEDIVPDINWPDRGLVELRGVSAQYKSTTMAESDSESDSNSVVSGITKPPLALKNITLTIHPGEKVAICGRTGSGKSSLLALLLKLLDPLPSTDNDHDQEPLVLIDNIPLHRIHRATLRQRLIAVPQDPVFLPDGSSFRANLDPTNTATLAECQRVLEAVQLWGFVQERAEGLHAPITAGTLSAGQRQLFSLGRAVLRARIRLRSTSSPPEEGSDNQDQGGILLLDEVSSSVDRETERMMQVIIRAEFRHYTIIAVSHRLEMIMDFDRVVVMDRGEVVEVGNPAALKGRAGSRFGELVAVAGS